MIASKEAENEMKIHKSLILVFCLLLVATGIVSKANSRSTSEEAEAMARKAAALVQSEEPDKAFATFQDKKGPFIRDDLYVFVLDSKGILMAHGGKPTLIGKRATEMKDINGYAFAKAMLDIPQEGWITYHWINASDGNKIEKKLAFIVRAKDYWVGVGYYP